MREAIFTLHTKAIPSAWKELLKELGCCHGDRQTTEFPIWWRIDGKGYTLWLAETHLTDSASTPPTWQFKLETLEALPPTGVEQWVMTYAAIIQFLEEAEVQYTVT